MTKQIQLTRGMFALVDNDDYVWLSQYKWYAQQSSKSNRFYAMGAYKGKLRLMHRLIINAPQGMEVDHINGNGLDNRKSNLRLATRSDNQHNQEPLRNNTSGYKGVTWINRDQTWRAQIRVNGKRYHLGHFSTPEAAAVAYNEAARKLHGSFAWLNKILGRQA